MDSAQFIRNSVSDVDRGRMTIAGDPELASAVSAVKIYQSLRFQNSYRDLIASGPYQAAARFFLEELYGCVDYSRRDAQFARIAGAIERLLPQQAVATAVALARLHAMTEQLDLLMGRAWLAAPATEVLAETYVFAWHTVGQEEQRASQLQLVLRLGRDLDRLTRTPGLRLAMKMMRRPAHAAGLHELQLFLESGFDIFASLAKRKTGAEGFLSLIEARESELMRVLFANNVDIDRLLREAILPS